MTHKASASHSWIHNLLTPTDDENTEAVKENTESIKQWEKSMHHHLSKAKGSKTKKTMLPHVIEASKKFEELQKLESARVEIAHKIDDAEKQAEKLVENNEEILGCTKKDLKKYYEKQKAQNRNATTLPDSEEDENRSEKDENEPEDDDSQKTNNCYLVRL